MVNPFTASPYADDGTPDRAAELLLGDDQAQYSVINVTNKYTSNRTSTKAVGADYPWATTYLALVEPHRETTFTLGDLSSYSAPYPSITWRIEGVNSTGVSVTSTFEDVNREYSVEIFVHDHTTNEVTTYESHTVFCKVGSAGQRVNGSCGLVVSMLCLSVGADAGADADAAAEAELDHAEARPPPRACDFTTQTHLTHLPPPAAASPRSLPPLPVCAP